jgi:hypothetical protein
MLFDLFKSGTSFLFDAGHFRLRRWSRIRAYSDVDDARNARLFTIWRLRQRPQRRERHIVNQA